MLKSWRSCLARLSGASPSESQNRLLRRRQRRRGSVRADALASQQQAQVEHLEERLVLATITWTGAGASDLFSNPDNWDTNTVPVNGDDVIINADPDSLEILFDASVPGTELTLNSLVGDEPFRITGDTLRLDGPGLFQFSGPLTLSGGTMT